MMAIGVIFGVEEGVDGGGRNGGRVLVHPLRLRWHHPPQLALTALVGGEPLGEDLVLLLLLLLLRVVGILLVEVGRDALAEFGLGTTGGLGLGLLGLGLGWLVCCVGGSSDDLC